jgi:nucleoid-associated protein YgaU
MNRETRVGLVLGLVVIIAFGMVLTEVRPPAEPAKAQEPEPVLETTYYRSSEPVMEPVAVRPRRVRTPQRQAPAPQPEPQRHIAEAPQPQPQRLRQAVMRQPQPEPQRTAPAPLHRTPQPQHATHRVEAGENLYRIAEQHYGRNNGHLWKRIYEANRNQLADSGSLTIGQELVIPALPGPSTPPQTALAQRPSRSAAREVTLEELQVETLGEHRDGVIRVYTVQKGDSLTRIAREQLRDASPQAVRRLIEANPQIDDPDAIRQGMKLKIPNS